MQVLRAGTGVQSPETLKSSAERTSGDSLKEDLCHFQAKASLVAQMVKNLPAMQGTQVLSMDWEDPLEKGMATHSYSCLENSMDKGAWWATVHGVAKSWT